MNKKKIAVALVTTGALSAIAPATAIADRGNANPSCAALVAQFSKKFLDVPLGQAKKGESQDLWVQIAQTKAYEYGYYGYCFVD